MCMLTYLPAGVKVPMEELSNGGTWNNDGHGWAVAAEIGNMITGHYMDKELALITFKAAREAFPDSPAMFHSRWATHGTVDTSNVHPFPVGRYAVMGHNGILPMRVKTNVREYRFQPVGKDTRSDTRILAEEYMMKLSPRGIFSRRERRWMGALIGKQNKLCILSVSPKLERPRGLLVNANSGNWHRGAWFSNYDYEHTMAAYRHYSKHWDDAYAMGKGETDPKDLSTHSGDGIGKSLALRDDECRWCLGVGGLNDWNVCDYCQTCQDCAQNLDNCMCSYGGKSAKDSADVFDTYGFCMECCKTEGYCECEEPNIVHVGPYGIGE